MEGQENKISELQTAIKELSGISEQIENLKGEVQELNASVNRISFPIREMNTLSKNMVEVRDQLNRPVTNTVKHEHYFPKIAWLTGVLFLALIIVCPGWYMTGTALKEYKANDTKYRYLKLYGNNPLKEILLTTDSLYRAYHDMRDSVIQKEDENRERFEMLQEANSMEKEAEKLKRKAKGQ